MSGPGRARVRTYRRTIPEDRGVVIEGRSARFAVGESLEARIRDIVEESW